jgi:SAM-dependent methyltransferase
MSAPLGILGSALRRAAHGRAGPLHLVGADGAPIQRINPDDWTNVLRTGDASLLARCSGATLDVGCGPGRLTAALSRRGRVVLGVDVSPEAIRQTRRRGAMAVCCDVFEHLPSEGQWQHVLLADGNIGIGGDPVRLLSRCAALMSANGETFAEVDPPGEPTWRGYVRLRYEGRESQAFPWAGVAADGVGPLAASAGLRVRAIWTVGKRWFARLTR